MGSSVVTALRVFELLTREIQQLLSSLLLDGQISAGLASSERLKVVMLVGAGLKLV